MQGEYLNDKYCPHSAPEEAKAAVLHIAAQATCLTWVYIFELCLGQSQEPWRR